ncbi:MAG: hypothetical protein LBH70_07965 [Spirochaetaceae bacterium]|jgi:hypothetical protein|nr:hypothetical protein [Spirochaetaceae bacterium]
MSFFHLLFIAAFLVIAYVVSMTMNRTRLQKMEASNKVFLEKYPDAAKVYPYSRSSVTSEAVQVHSVDGGPPEFFYEAGKLNGIAGIIGSITGNSNNTGFYLKPGTTPVEISYYHTRPGLLYKNVTTTTDAVKKELKVEPNKTYRLSFDRKAETFTLEESAG